MAKRDFYDILGISKSASQDEIKKAHRKLARQFHPDMNKDNPGATEKFKEVQEAYDALSDETKRRNYDQFGHAGVGAGVGAGGDPFQRGGGGGGGAGPRGWPGGQGPMPGGAGGFNPADIGDGNFGDIFEQLFGGGGRGRQPKQRPRGTVETPRGGDIETPVTITFYQAARGSSVKLQLNRDGRTETLDVKIPAGVKDASRIRIKGRGDPSGNQPGDLFIVTTVTPHAYYRRDGLDVLIDLPLTIWEAIDGARVTVPTLDGPVDLTIPPGTGSHSKLRIRGRGIFKGEEKGDQFVVVKIVIPKTLDESDKNTLREMALKHASNPRAELGWDV